MTQINAEKDGVIIQILKQAAQITNVVGAGDNARIWPDDAKQGAQLPHICIYDADADESTMHLTGTSGYRVTRIQIYAIAAKKSQARALAELARVKCLAYRGQVGTIFVNWIKGGYMDSGIDEPEKASDTKRYWTRCVLDVMHSEPTSLDQITYPA